MSTSATTSTHSTHSTQSRVALRMRLLAAPSADQIDGAWWPQSRDLQVEAADLVDHFPLATGYVNRLLFSRPDWDGVVDNGFGIRKIRARRGPVKVGSFPSDDTRLMVLALSTGQRIRLRVIPSDTDPGEAAKQLREVIAGTDAADDLDQSRWDDENPVF